MGWFPGCPFSRLRPARHSERSFFMRVAQFAQLPPDRHPFHSAPGLSQLLHGRIPLRVLKCVDILLRKPDEVGSPAAPDTVHPHQKPSSQGASSSGARHAANVRFGVAGAGWPPSPGSPLPRQKRSSAARKRTCPSPEGASSHGGFGLNGTRRKVAACAGSFHSSTSFRGLIVGRS